MARLAMWTFFFLDLLGILWCLRTLAREVRKYFTWWGGRHAYTTATPTLAIPAEFLARMREGSRRLPQPAHLTPEPGLRVVS